MQGNNKNVSFPRGVTVCLSDDDKKEPIGKILSHRPIRLEGYLMTHLYIIHKTTGSNQIQSSDLFIAFQDEIAMIK